MEVGVGRPARPPASHHTNHYTKSVAALEGVLEERLAQLTLLMQENSALKRREAALQSAIGSLAGSVSAAAAAAATQAAPQPQDSPPEAVGSISDSRSFLASMQQRESEVQQMMEQLGLCDYQDLYSTWLLRRAMACPSRASSYLGMSQSQRVKYVMATVQKLGLLVGKYDMARHPSTSLGTPREQVDHLVDELCERTLAFCLLAAPERQLEMACLNMETGEPEPYPEGWWAVVIEAMALTNDQKTALRICYEKVKPKMAALTEQHQRLSWRLAELQQLQLQHQRKFEAQAEHIMDAALSLKEASLQQRHHAHIEAQRKRQAALAARWRQQQQPGEGLGDNELGLLPPHPELSSEGSPSQPQPQAQEAPTPSGASAQQLAQPEAAPAAAAHAAHAERGPPSPQLACVTAGITGEQQHRSWAEEDEPQAMLADVADQRTPSFSSSNNSATPRRSPGTAAAATAASQQQPPPSLSGGGGSGSGGGGSGSGGGGSGSGGAGGAAAAPPPAAEDAGATDAMRHALAKSDSQGQRELLLQVYNHEQQQLELQLDRMTAQLKMQQYCLHTFVLNICSKKQMAVKYVFCYPWCPESFSMCEALDELGW